MFNRFAERGSQTFLVPARHATHAILSEALPQIQPLNRRKVHTIVGGLDTSAENTRRSRWYAVRSAGLHHQRPTTFRRPRRSTRPVATSLRSSLFACARRSVYGTTAVEPSRRTLPGFGGSLSFMASAILESS